jgi:hypothetical protein
MPTNISTSRPVNVFGWFVGVVIACAFSFLAGVIMSEPGTVATTPATVCTGR